MEIAPEEFPLGHGLLFGYRKSILECCRGLLHVLTSQQTDSSVTYDGHKGNGAGVGVMTRIFWDLVTHI